MNNSTVQKRSVVHVSDYGGPYSGNFIASLLALQRPLAQCGLHEVLVFSDIAGDREWLAELRALDVPVYLLPNSTGRLASAPMLARIAQEEGAVLLHTHFSKYDITAAMASASPTLKRRLRVLWHVHSGFPEQLWAGFTKKVGRTLKDKVKFQVLGHLAYTMSVSTAVHNDILRRGMPQSRAFVVPNGVDFARATRPRRSRAETRREWGIADNVPVLLCFGWDPKRKGVDWFATATRELAAQSRNILAIVVGDSAETFLHQQMGFGELPPWLRVVPPVECVADLYAAADIFVSASRSEGFPYAMLEAMANSLPVLATDLPGLEWSHGIEGVILVPPGDISGMVAGLNRLLDHRGNGDVKAAAIRRVAQNYSVERWADSVCSAYEKILHL